MAATALEVLSLAAAKRELRIPDEDDQHDGLLQAQIGSAVSFVGRFLRAPLTDSVERHRCSSPGTDRPLAIRADHVQSLAPIRYWPAGRALREEPDTIAVADLGRRAQVAEWFCIYPPADGWPEVEAGSMLEVDLTRSITLTTRTTALQHAVILAVRQLYNGYHTITGTAAMYALIAPWRRLDADPPGTLVTVIDEAPTGAGGPFYLLASEDSTFSQFEVVASDAQRALEIPAGTIPDGEERYIAYGVPVTEGEPDYLYHYRAGARSTQNFINAFEAAPNLDIIGVRHRLVRSRVQWASSANGLVLEAGRLADVPETTVDPALPTVAGLRYLLAREDDDQFVAADVITTGSEDQAQAVPEGTVPDGETRWFAYARPAGRGAYTFSYLYPCAFPNTLNQFNAFTDNGSELVINGEDCRILLARAAYTTVANGTCWEAD